MKRKREEKVEDADEPQHEAFEQISAQNAKRQKKVEFNVFIFAKNVEKTFFFSLLRSCYTESNSNNGSTLSISTGLETLHLFQRQQATQAHDGIVLLFDVASDLESVKQLYATIKKENNADSVPFLMVAIRNNAMKVEEDEFSTPPSITRFDVLEFTASQQQQVVYFEIDAEAESVKKVFDSLIEFMHLSKRQQQLERVAASQFQSSQSSQASSITTCSQDLPSAETATNDKYSNTFKPLSPPHRPSQSPVKSATEDPIETQGYESATQTPSAADAMVYAYSSSHFTTSPVTILPPPASIFNSSSASLTQTTHKPIKLEAKPEHPVATQTETPKPIPIVPSTSPTTSAANSVIGFKQLLLGFLILFIGIAISSSMFPTSTPPADNSTSHYSATAPVQCPEVVCPPIRCPEPISTPPVSPPSTSSIFSFWFSASQGSLFRLSAYPLRFEIKRSAGLQSVFTFSLSIAEQRLSTPITLTPVEDSWYFASMVLSVESRYDNKVVLSATLSLNYNSHDTRQIVLSDTEFDSVTSSIQQLKHESLHVVYAGSDTAQYSKLIDELHQRVFKPEEFRTGSILAAHGKLKTLLHLCSRATQAKIDSEHLIKDAQVSQSEYSRIFKERKDIHDLMEAEDLGVAPQKQWNPADVGALLVALEERVKELRLQVTKEETEWIQHVSSRFASL